MSEQKQNVDLIDVHEAMVQSIKNKMPMLKTVQSYEPFTRDTIETPSVLIEAVEMKPGKRTGDERLSVTVEFLAHCCLSIRTDRVELEIRNFAAKLMRVIEGNRWGLAEAVERPTRLSAMPGMFKPDDKGFESWVVSWEQTIHLGNVWQDTEFMPQEVFIGLSPEIGAAHKDDYEIGT